MINNIAKTEIELEKTLNKDIINIALYKDENPLYKDEKIIYKKEDHLQQYNSKECYMHNVFLNEKKLKIINKDEFTNYYSCTHKYPLLVVEKLNKNTGKMLCKDYSREKNIEYPLRLDEELPEDYMLSETNYNDYMEYGGSYGQNAPAINHKTNMNTYLETFKLSNLTPREVTLNNGMWYILEHWSKNLIHSEKIKNITIYTGSIPNKKNTKINSSEINVPTHCFKIITANDIINDNIMYIACFLIPNKRPPERIYKLYKYLTSLKDISKATNINYFEVFKKHSGFTDQTIIQSLKKQIRIDIHLNDNKNLIKQTKSAVYYGNLIYSQTLQELNMIWKKCTSMAINNNIHDLYYLLAKKRILKNVGFKKIQELHLQEKSKKKDNVKNKTPTKKSHKRTYILSNNDILL